MPYYIDLFTGQTWKEYRDAGAKITGFRQSRSRIAGKVQRGDIFLCYLTGVMRWVGALEVISSSTDKTKIWSVDDFPVRFEVKPLVLLDPEHGVPMNQLEGRVDFYAGPEDRGKFKAFVRMSPNTFKRNEDGKLILDLLHDAQQNPQFRPVDPRKLAKKPLYKAEQRSGKKTIPAKVSIPEPEDIPSSDSNIQDDTETTKHTEIQYNLLKLGAEMGFDVWVARNDRGKSYRGQLLGELPGVLDTLPTQFNAATTRTIEFIDILWLKGNSIVAAFEVESTTLIYSGLLRMSDLLALQPNLEIQLFIVAPNERREKVENEILRPTFKLREKPLSLVCGFLPFEDFMIKVEGIRNLRLGTSLKPDFLSKMAEYFIEDISDE